QDDVAVVLAGCFAHDAADGLDDVDHAAAGVQEQHRVESGDVDTFGQAAGVGQDAAFAVGDRGLEPLQFAVAFQSVERAVDVAHGAGQVQVRSVDVGAVVLGVG